MQHPGTGIFVTICKSVLAALCLFPQLSFSAGTDERLDQFLSLSLEELMNTEITIASAGKQTVSEAPGVVTVITEEDIKATGATNLVDVLEGVPGVHIRANQFAYRPLVHFRGSNANQTLLMVNGNPMKDLMWGFGIFWKGLPASVIDRVEIIRGPGSALFGADAAAGVINVITKTAGKMEHSEAGIRAGSFDTKTAWAQYGASWNDIEVGLTAEFSDTDGHDPFIGADGQTLQDQRWGTNVSYAPDHAQYGWSNQDIRLSVAKGHWRMLADYMRHSDLEIGFTGAGVLDPVTSAEDSRWNLDLLYKNESFGEHWALDAAIHYQDLDYTSGDGFQERPPGYVDATGLYPDGVINRMRSSERRLNLESSGLYSGISGHSIRLGAGYTWEDLYSVEQYSNQGIGPDGMSLPPGGPQVDISDTPFAFAPETARKIGYLFAQDIWSVSDSWELTAGARYDHYSDFGSTLNPRLALVWHSTDKLTSKLLYGQAFRAPSYQELYAVTSRSLPNAGLNPELSRTWDLAFSYAAAENLQLDITFFHFKQTDLIRAVDVPGLPLRRFENVGEHTIRGIELEAKWHPAKQIMLSGNYTIRDQDDTPYRAVYEPDQEAYFRVDWIFRPGWNWNLQTNWIDERPRAPGDSRSALNSYAVTDTTVRYRGFNSWEFAVSVRNLFDENAREYTGPSVPDDLPLPERNFYAETRYKF